MGTPRIGAAGVRMHADGVGVRPRICGVDEGTTGGRCPCPATASPRSSTRRAARSPAGRGCHLRSYRICIGSGGRTWWRPCAPRTRRSNCGATPTAGRPRRSPRTSRCATTSIVARGAKGDQELRHHHLVRTTSTTCPAGHLVRGGERHAELVVLSDILHDYDNRNARTGQPPLTEETARTLLRDAQVEFFHVRDAGDPLGGQPARPCESCIKALVYFGMLPWSHLAFVEEWRPQPAGRGAAAGPFPRRSGVGAGRRRLDALGTPTACWPRPRSRGCARCRARSTGTCRSRRRSGCSPTSPGWSAAGAGPAAGTGSGSSRSTRRRRRTAPTCSPTSARVLRRPAVPDRQRGQRRHAARRRRARPGLRPRPGRRVVPRRRHRHRAGQPDDRRPGRPHPRRRLGGDPTGRTPVRTITRGSV